MSVTQELLKKIEQQINQTSLDETLSQKWEVVEIKDGVATVVGLEKAVYSEIVVFENGIKGLVLDMLPHQVGILVLGDYTHIQKWQTVTTTGQVFSIPVGKQYLGRVIDGIGNPIDGGETITGSESYPVERIAPWVIDRQSVDTPLQTGIKAIDAMTPIGRGQRQLIIWDRQTGKTTVAIDTILNQKGKNVACVYVAIGQKESKIARIAETLRQKWAMEYTTIVNASINTPAVMQYIAPYVWCTIGERFMNNGQDALIIYDDLSKHAVAYREISLLLRRPPGREAYPWDVFYLHSRLLERAARLNKKLGWWSLTALPIIETQMGDVSAYIPTNVISITDGQVYLESDLFNSGIKPAINVWLSVSRVWWAAQTWLMKKVSGKLKLELAAYRELESFSQFWSDLDPITQKKIARGKRMVEMLKQNLNSPLEFYEQALLIYAGINGYLDTLDLDLILPLEKIFNEKLATTYKDMTQKIVAEKKLTDEVEEFFKKVIAEWIEEVKALKAIS